MALRSRDGIGKTSFATGAASASKSSARPVGNRTSRSGEAPRRDETALGLTGMLFAGLGAPAKTTLFAGVPETALDLAC